MKNAGVLVLMLLTALSMDAAFAENNQAILPINSPVFGLLRSIYLEQGKELLSTAGPFSVDEILLMREKIDPSSLSPAGRLAYDEISAILSSSSPAQPEPISFGWRPSITLEGYFHTNPDPTTTEWEYRYSARQPLFSIPIESWVGEGAYAIMDLSLKQTHDAFNPLLVATNYMNIPLSLDYIDVETPFRAFLALGGRSWSFVMGRDRFSWGNGETGNLVLSDTPDYYDFVRFTGYWRYFKYTAIWAMLLTNLAPRGGGGSIILTAADLLAANPFLSYPRNYFLHRLDFSLFDKVSIAIAEGTLIGGVAPELAYFNPLMIFHSLADLYHASEILEVDMSYNPWRYLEIYGQFSCTQIQLPYEIIRYGKDAADIPDAYALLGGLRSSVPIWVGFINGGIEFAYLNPWMYVKENPLTTYEWWRYQFSNAAGGTQWVSSSLGYYTGPDAMVFAVWAGYNVPQLFSVGLDYKRQVKGQNTLDTPYAAGPEAAALTTPTGTPEIKNVIHLKGSLDLLSFLSFAMDLYGIYTENFGNIAGVNVMDYQAVLSMRAHF